MLSDVSGFTDRVPWVCDGTSNNPMYYWLMGEVSTNPLNAPVGFDISASGDGIAAVMRATAVALLISILTVGVRRRANTYLGSASNCTAEAIGALLHTGATAYFGILWRFALILLSGFALFTLALFT
jgi:hypothetical protein